MTEKKTIDSVVLFIRDKQLLIPRSTIEEVVPYERENMITNPKACLLGSFYWHEHNVPLASYELVNHEAVPFFDHNSKIIIVKGIHFTEQLPFYALITQKAPHPVIISENKLTYEDTDLGPAELLKVQFTDNDYMLTIPHLEYMEKRIVSVTQQNVSIQDLKQLQ